MRTVRVLLLFSCCLAMECIDSSDARPNAVKSSAEEDSSPSEKVFPRVLDFHILGLYEKSSDGSETLLRPGLRVVSDAFFLYVLYAGRMLPVSRQVYIDHFTTELRNGQPLDTLDSIIVLENVKLHNETKSYTCSMRVIMGNQTCRLMEGPYFRVEIIERIHLMNCQQSSIADKRQPDNCKRAYAIVSQQTVGLSGCSVTELELRPWWRADAPSSFLFDKLDIYSASDLNQWTANFDVFIEETLCVRVKDKTPFVKKTFQCGLHGSGITVRATGARRELMALCEIVAYGTPGGCYDIKKRETQCSRSFPGHIGQGSAPYPGGLYCEWVIAPERRSVALLLQFHDFATAGPQDYVAIYEGKGTQGRQLAMFYGSGSDGQLPPKYGKSGTYGAREYILSGNITNVVTVQFVTAKDVSGSVRSAQTHMGFRISYMAVSEDNTYGTGKENDFHTKRRICPVDRYAEILWATCATRGGINPVHIYGPTTGGAMLAAIENSNGTLPLTEFNIPLMQRTLGYVPFTMPEIESDLTDYQVSVLCGAYKKPEVPPRYFNECCCKYCSRRELSKYCLWTYGRPESCTVDIMRVESNQKEKK